MKGRILSRKDLESCTENVLPLLEMHLTTKAKIARRTHFSVPYPHRYLPSGSKVRKRVKDRKTTQEVYLPLQLLFFLLFLYILNRDDLCMPGTWEMMLFHCIKNASLQMFVLNELPSWYSGEPDPALPDQGSEELENEQNHIL